MLNDGKKARWHRPLPREAVYDELKPVLRSDWMDWAGDRERQPPGAPHDRDLKETGDALSLKTSAPLCGVQ